MDDELAAGEPYSSLLCVSYVSHCLVVAAQNRSMTGSLTIREEDTMVAMKPTDKELENLYVMLSGKRTITVYLREMQALEDTDVEGNRTVDPDVMDAQANKLLQCMDHLSYICDPEQDMVYDSEVLPSLVLTECISSCHGVNPLNN